MLEKSKYNLVDDSIDPRIPADNEGQFQHGLSFEVKFIGSLDIVRPKSRMEILAAMRQIRNTKEDILKNVGNRTALDQCEWGPVYNILQNISFCVLRKKENLKGLNYKKYEFKVKNIKKKKVYLVVSVDGVRVVLRRRKKKYGYSWDDSQMTLAQDPIFRIFYVSHDSQDLKIFSYIARDKKSNVFRCNVFKSKKKSQAMKIVRTVGQAFEVCHKQSLDNADAWLIDGEEERTKEETSASSSSSENSVCLETNEKNTKEDILKKIGNRRALAPIHLYCMATKPMQVNWGQLTTFFKIPSFVFYGRKKVIQVCEDPILVMETLSHPLAVNHQVQLFQRQLQQQEQRSQAASAQVSLLQQQLSVETSARTEAQTRVQQLLQQNTELLQHLSLLVKHVQELELRTQAHKRSPLGSQDSLLEIALRTNMPAVPRDLSPNPTPPPSRGFPLSASLIGLEGFCFFTEPPDKEKKKTEQDRDSGQGHDEEQSGDCSPPGIQFLSALETPGFRESGIASGYESNTDESDDRDSCGQ